MSEKDSFIAAEHAAHVGTVEAPTVAQMTRWLACPKAATKGGPHARPARLKSAGKGRR